MVSCPAPVSRPSKGTVSRALQRTSSAGSGAAPVPAKEPKAKQTYADGWVCLVGFGPTKMNLGLPFHLGTSKEKQISSILSRIKPCGRRRQRATWPYVQRSTRVSCQLSTRQRSSRFRRVCDKRGCDRATDSSGACCLTDRCESRLWQSLEPPDTRAQSLAASGRPGMPGAGQLCARCHRAAAN